MCKKLIKILSLIISIIMVVSVLIIPVSAAKKTVTADATSSKVLVSIGYSSPTTLILYKVSCREKHPQTGSIRTVTDSNSTGCGTSVGVVMRPHTGYRFVNSSKYNFFTYSIAGSAKKKESLPKI